MSNFLNQVFLVTFLAASIRMATPILLAAMGEIYAERAGIANINLEGQMLVGAFGAFLATYYTNNLLVGTLSGAVTGALLALLFAYVCITLKANQIIIGITLNIFAMGLTSFVYRALFGVTSLPPAIPIYEIISIPVLKEIPFLGPILFEQNILAYATIIIFIVSNVILFKTKLGLRIRAAGEYPRAAETMGVNVIGIRYLSTIICGAMAGLGGAFLPLGMLGGFVESITAGRGFIALAIVIFGKWAPYKALGAGLLFGAADALQLRLQAMGMELPYQFLLMLPYLLTIFAMIFTGKDSVGPAAVGIPYDREKI